MMTRLFLTVCTAALAGLAAAQTFFRDDFDTLSSEWIFSPPMENSSAALTYEINQGNLVATGVLPGNPAFDGGGGSFRRLFLPAGQYVNGLTDQVRLRARFTLPRGDVMESISFSLFGISQFNTTRSGSIRYTIQRLSDGNFASTLSQQGGGEVISTFWTLDPLPYYEFDLFRQGDEVVATFNGMEMNRRPYIQSDFNQVRIGMGGYYGTTTVGPRLDYIEVVPEPIAILGFGAAAAKVMLRKRKKKQTPV
jgi:hypothetical protein